MATDLTSLVATVKVILAIKAEKALDESTPKDDFNLTASDIFKSTLSTGLKSDQFWHDRRALAASANEELDLAGSLTNAFGGTVTFAEVRWICIINTSSKATLGGAETDAQIQIGGAAANDAPLFFADPSDKATLDAGPEGEDGSFMLWTNSGVTGWVVTAGTQDLLKIENLDGVDAAEYVIAIGGESA